MIVMVMVARTGRVIGLSAAGFAVVATAGLAQHHAPPQVACQFGYLLMYRHRLIEVGQNIAELWSLRHTFLYG
jgi:hypothetical protein